MARRWSAVHLAAPLALCGLLACVGQERFHARTATPACLRLPGQPGALVAYQGRVLVSVFGKEGGVAIVDPVKRRLDGYLPVDPKYCVDDLAVAGDKLFVGQSFSPHVLVYDLPTRRLVTKIPVGGEGALAASPDGRHVYFGSNKESAFAIIDAATYAFRKVPYPVAPLGWQGHPPTIGRGCLAAMASPDGAALYLGIQRPTPFLAVYNLKQDTYEKTIGLAAFEGDVDEDGIVGDLAISPDGERLFAGMWQSRHGLFVINRRTHQVETNLPFESLEPPFDSGAPMGLAIYGERLVAAVRHRHELAILDVRPPRVVAVAPLGTAHGPTKVVVVGHTAVASDSEGQHLWFVDLRRALRGGS